MSTDDLLGPRVVTLDSVHMDKTAISAISLHEADADLKAYWKAQTPHARLEALELMHRLPMDTIPIPPDFSEFLRSLEGQRVEYLLF